MTPRADAALCALVDLAVRALFLACGIDNTGHVTNHRRSHA